MKKRRLALLALVLTMVLITAFPMTAYAAETPNTIQSWSADGNESTREEELPNAHFPMAFTPQFKGIVRIKYTTSGNPISYVEVDNTRVIPQIIRTRYYMVVPGVYRYEHIFEINVAGIVKSNTDQSLIEFATGNNLYGVNVRWQ